LSIASSAARPIVRSLEVVAETDAHEGPVYAADEHALYFTTVRRESVAIKRLDLADGGISTVRSDANMANGMALDRDGRLVVCEQGTFTTPARITRLDRRTGEAETVVEGGLSSPNDVVVKSDGTIWFTDPIYGYLQGFRPEPALGDRVYRYDPASGRLAVVADYFDKPNGIAFSAMAMAVSPTGGSLPSARRSIRTASRQTREGGSTPRTPGACRCSPRAAS
jgi:gluconolactonase